MRKEGGHIPHFIARFAANGMDIQIFAGWSSGGLKGLEEQFVLTTKICIFYQDKNLDCDGPHPSENSKYSVYIYV